MTRLSLVQATELAKAYFGPTIEMITDRSRLSDRCTIYHVIYDEKWKAYRKELCHGRDWLECLCKVIPELAYREFSCDGAKWTEFIAEMYRIRQAKKLSHNHP